MLCGWKKCYFHVFWRCNETSVIEFYPFYLGNVLLTKLCSIKAVLVLNFVFTKVTYLNMYSSCCCRIYENLRSPFVTVVKLRLSESDVIFFVVDRCHCFVQTVRLRIFEECNIRFIEWQAKPFLCRKSRPYIRAFQRDVLLRKYLMPGFGLPPRCSVGLPLPRCWWRVNSYQRTLHDFIDSQRPQQLLNWQRFFGSNNVNINVFVLIDIHQLYALLFNTCFTVHFYDPTIFTPTNARFYFIWRKLGLHVSPYQAIIRATITRNTENTVCQINK
jgi:hypothetical protein